MFKINNRSEIAERIKDEIEIYDGCERWGKRRRKRSYQRRQQQILEGEARV